MSSIVNNILILILVANKICCKTQNFSLDSDNRVKIDVKQKYNVTLEGINAALDEARWIQIVT